MDDREWWFECAWELIIIVRRRRHTAFKAGDVADDRERLMSDVPNLGKKFRGPMIIFSCLPSDAEQTSVISHISHHRRCWASPDSSGVARGRFGGSNPPIEKCQKNFRRQNCRKYTKLKFARVKASSNDIININRFANFWLWIAGKCIWQPGSARTRWGSYITPAGPWLLFGEGREKGD